MHQITGEIHHSNTGNMTRIHGGVCTLSVLNDCVRDGDGGVHTRPDAVFMMVYEVEHLPDIQYNNIHGRGTLPKVYLGYAILSVLCVRLAKSIPHITDL